jgi:Peptidase propeptide and YPEB domain.
MNEALTIGSKALCNHASRGALSHSKESDFGGTIMKKLLPAILGVAIAVSAPVWVAQAQEAPAQQLNIKQIIAKLESAGYTNIHDVEKDDGVWEVDAKNSAGQRVELIVDPVTGEVLHEERDDWWD